MKLIGFYQEMDSAYAADWGGSIPPAESGAGKYSPADVVRYLKAGYPILDVMELTVDVIGDAFRVPGGSSLLSDGEFVWREDLAAYVEKYRIDLPHDFLENAERHNFQIPAADRDALLRLSVEASRSLGFEPRS
ncbi:hypothetical protein [Streptomyces sp. NPDC085596]|uniref:hypothetical protein n=1 Tax=Streptomyces sp. NPDC085596 TaxID=3365731 RepID=UPI0037D82AE0